MGSVSGSFLFLFRMKGNTMSINIDLDPPMVRRLREKAEQLGKTLDEYILELLQKEVVEEDEMSREEFLLQQVNLGVSAEKWERYYTLIESRDKELLSEAEHEELLQLSDEIERRNAERLPYIFELARYKSISPEQLIADLGLQ
jgi:predicted DNA-binding protein